MWLVKDLLEMEGFSIVCIEPRQVDTLCTRQDVELFLIDIMLPGMSGIQVAERLRRKAFTDTPMVAMSASSLMLATAQSSGLFQDVMGKPFDVDRLLATV